MVSENEQRIASALALAVAKEMQRKQKPQAGDRRPSQVHQALVMESFKKMKSLWPQNDQASLNDAFAYHPTAVQKTAAEECDRTWLVAHAIVESASQGIAFLLESVTQGKYSMLFSNVDAPFALSRPTPHGFLPGKASLHYPELALRKGVQGKTTARITVDAAGNVSEVKIIDDALVPASVTSGDERVFTSKELFQFLALQSRTQGCT